VEGAVGADFGGTDGAFEDARDLGEGEFLKTTEEEDFAITALEAGEGGVEKGVIVAGRSGFAGVRTVVGVMLKIHRIGGVRGCVGFAEVVRCAATGEVIHPSGEAAFVAVGVAVFEHALEDDLGDVLGAGAIAGELHEETEKWTVMTFKEFSERVQLAAAHSEHEFVIGAGGEGVHGGDRVVFEGINREQARIDRNIWSGGEHGRWTGAGT
jgi:hypothetical protein